MIILQVPTSDRLYQVLWHARQQDESIPELVIRVLMERFLGWSIPGVSVPERSLLDWVEVVDHA